MTLGVVVTVGAPPEIRVVDPAPGVALGVIVIGGDVRGLVFLGHGLPFLSIPGLRMTS
jgi:hypothetical protein